MTQEELTIEKIVEVAYYTAIKKGFWSEENLPRKLCLIHSEVSEALGVLRDTTKNCCSPEFIEELADIVIRVADLSGYVGGDLSKAIFEKLEKNKIRPFKHNKRF